MPAAGSGRRFGRELPKQYMPLAGRTVIECSLAPFLADSRCAGAVIAIAASDKRFGELAIAKEPRLRTVTGGEQRADSVLSALESLQAPDDDWVTGARCRATLREPRGDRCAAPGGWPG